MNYRSTTYTVTIGANEAASSVIEKPFGSFMAILFPASWEGMNFGFYACDTLDGTFAQVVDETGAPLSFTVSAGKWVIVPASAAAGLASIPYLKIVPETTQTSARSLKVSTKA